MLVDGGCLDNMPYRDMHALKTGPNVVVNVQKDTSAPIHVDYDSLPGRGDLLRQTVMPFGKRATGAPGLISTVMRSLLVGQDASLRGLNPHDLHVRPPAMKGPGFLAWSQHRLFYDLGYAHAKDDVFGDLLTSDDSAKVALRRAAGLG
jgi:NTE family protein